MAKLMKEALVRLKEETEIGLKEDCALADWLSQQSIQAGTCAWLLAFADDVVIWGKAESGKLLETSAPLTPATLQTLHLFGEKGELRLWKQAGRLTGCWLKDQTGVESYDLAYMLWGTQVEKPDKTQAEESNKPQVEKLSATFSRVADGRQGLSHSVPLPLANVNLSKRPLRLMIRNYLAEDGDGQVFVSCSRLVKVFNSQEGQK